MNAGAGRCDEGIGMDDLNTFADSALAEIDAAASLDTLDAIRVRLLGKAGSVTAQLKSLGKLPPDERKAQGERINAVRDRLGEALAQRKEALEQAALGARLASERIDISLPGRDGGRGAAHPVSRALARITSIFERLGYQVADGPEIEDDWYNFEALNFPPHHPARTMHDTFWFPDGRLLRTHTSPVQIRSMQGRTPPIRIIAPGKVYRSDSDQTHTPMFHQVEGLVIDKKTHFGHMKWVLEEFCKAFFEVEGVKMRFRPSFFPFTEPSAEVDIQCSRKGGEIRFGEGDDWLEILGCGMVHPNVLRNCGLDPDVYQGFAWGMGIDRIAMLKYGMPDLRPFFEADVRWLSHYGFRPLDLPTLTGGLTS